MAEDDRFTVAKAHQFGEKAVDLADEHAGLALDFSIESLRDLDELLTMWHEQGNTCDSMSTTVYFFGCYLGEVIIRNLGGAWSESTARDYERVARFPVVVDLPGIGRISPIDKVFKLLDCGSGDSILFYCQVLQGLQKEHR